MRLPPQPREGAAGSDQLIIGAAFGYLPAIENHNLVDLVEALQGRLAHDHGTFVPALLIPGPGARGRGR